MNNMNSESMIVSLRKPKRPEVSPPSTASEPPRPRPPQSSGPSYAPIVGLILIISLIGGVYYFFFRGPTPQVKPADTKVVAEETQVAAAQEVKDVIAAVGKHIVLPKGEEPTVATVTDPEKLKDQAFFANAKEGYKVLIYTQARKAYLYDPTRDKLIEVAPITTDIQ